MKSLKGIMYFAIAMAILSIPLVCKAEELPCTNITSAEDLEQALTNNSCPVITLDDDIETSKHLEVSRNVTIDGQGHTIKGSNEWYNSSGLRGDQSIITSIGPGGNLTLTNLNLTHGPKQGAQAFGGGILTLNGVTISDCKYSGLISNGATIIIKDVTLNTTYGIEVGISEDSQRNGGTTPEIIMDGKIESTADYILYMDNGTSSDLKIKNEEGTENYIYAYGNKVVITNKNNTILYESAPITSSNSIESDGTENIKIHIVTIEYGDNSEQIAVPVNETLSDLSSIDLARIKNAFEGMEFINFKKDNGEIFDETTPITSDITLIAQYKEIVMEPTTPNTPQTFDGITSIIVLGFISIIGILIGTRYLRKSN